MLMEVERSTWKNSSNLSTEREAHTATLMPNGQVLVAGGSGGNSQSVEVFNINLGFQPLWQPVIDTLTFPISPGEALEIGGSGLRGYGSTEASGSAANNSATNYPLVQLRSLDSGQTYWLSPDPGNPFSTTSYTSLRISNFPSGYALATIFVSDIPSISKFTLIVPPGPSIYLPLVHK